MPRRDSSSHKSVQGVIGQLNVVEDRAAQLARSQRVLIEAAKRHARNVGLALLVALLYALHWVAFPERTRLGPIEHSFPSSLGISALIWLAMLVPAARASIKPSEKAKRLGVETSDKTGDVDLLGVGVELHDGSNSVWARIQRAYYRLLPPGMLRLRLMELVELAMRIHGTPEFWTARLIRVCNHIDQFLQ